MIKNNSIVLFLIWQVFLNGLVTASFQEALSNETLASGREAMGSAENVDKPAVRLNATHAEMFKNWIKTKSDTLYQLSMNFSGYNLLNETYNIHLRRDARLSWINFTEMIVNISNTVSEVMYNKTVLVKNLSDMVEKTYDEFIVDQDKVINSTNHVYLDSKSPKTFCDVAETFNQKIAEEKKNKINTKPIINHSSNSSTKHRQKRSLLYTPLYAEQFYLAPKLVQDELVFYPNQTVKIINLKEAYTRPARPLNISIDKSRKYTYKPLATYSTLTTIPFENDDNEDEFYDDDDDDLDDEMDNYDLSDEYWDVQCINRSYDENFKSVQKINRNESTIQVPINVYKQEIAMNMTAYWTEALDTQFKKNYDQDEDLFWQYFCSSNGLYRRYPAAYWSAPDDDFFDCRLQSWYIMAAASPKDVLILLDVSGSMTGLRLEIGKRLIEFILDTFTDNDFFNVLTFSNHVQYLFNDESDYRDRFIQAGKANKLKFKEKLGAYKNTSQQGRLTDPLIKVFELFNQSHLVRSGCNKMIMIITDGHADNVDPIFDKYNSDKRVRVFSFKIGRDMNDPSAIKKLACDNNGEFYHVVTLTDINEHVYEYIPVLSRPMALMGVRETTWSNVFIGYLDNELKIAVARPAFRSIKYNFTNFELNRYMNKSIDFKVDNYEKIIKKKKSSHGFYLTSENQRETIQNAEKEIRKQDVFLGVVGIDVPVLKLISKVSPKYQMGVGIYIIMLDNNGFIVFHPSIKKEISESKFDYKGTSHSIEMEKFEIPIGNEYEFEMLEHDMIDQKTGNTTLYNWKREGLRVIRRQTEYVYTSVEKTPFTVAIASPNSFGRYYIDLPVEKEKYFDGNLTDLIKNKTQLSIDTNIQLYNCSYSYFKLAERLIDSKSSNDFCIRYLYIDYDQALAIKSDLTIHNLYYKKYNFSLFNEYQNLIKSSFYGTYSGITFYLPVTFYRPKLNNTNNSSSTSSETEAYKMSLNLFGFDSNKHTYSFEKQYYTRSIEFSDYLRTEFNKTDEPVIIYFLNETSTGTINPTINETVSATIPLWLDKVPAAVAGVVYDTQKLHEQLFYTPVDCRDDSCINICNKTSNLNFSCYLIDEHGFVVLTNSEQYWVGQPLYKVNPWLMLQLEFDGLFDLIVTGNKLQECNRPPISINGAVGLFNLIKIVFKVITFLAVGLFNLIQNSLYVAGRKVDTSASTSDEVYQTEWRIQNSHCFYFGIYSFNLSNWKSRDATILKPWCHSSDDHQKQYLAGYLRKSNLIMVVAEHESQVSKCGNIENLAKSRPPAWNYRPVNSNNANVTDIKKKYSINRYRNNPEYCHNYFANESNIFFCKSLSVVSFKDAFLFRLITHRFYIFLFSHLIFYFFDLPF